MLRLAHGWVGSECTKGLSEGAISRTWYELVHTKVITY